MRWTAKAPALAAVYTGGDLVEGPTGYLYGFPGRILNTFWRYDINANTWSDVAAADPPYTLSYGASLIFDGNRYIYAIRGNSDDAFMRYDTQTDTWDLMANTDYNAPIQEVANTNYVGADLAYDGVNTIYAIQGNTYSGFSTYNILTNTWTPQASLPVIAYDGSQITYDNNSNSLYYFPGWSTPFFYKYDISSQTWTRLTNTPIALSSGAVARNINGTIYVLRGGGTQTMWQYNISTASWLIPTMGLFGGFFRGSDYYPFNYGANIVSGDANNFYITQGNYNNLFVRYNSISGETTRMADAPAGFYLGTALAYESTHNKIYAITSQYVRRLYIYDIATDSWSEDVLNPPPFDVGAGASMIYDGSRYIYWTRAGGNTNFQRYDTQGSGGTKWGAALGVIPAGVSYGSEMVFKSPYLYLTRGNNTTGFYRYNTAVGGTWNDPAVVDLPPTKNIYNDGFLVDGGGDNLFSCLGGNVATCFQYSISGNTWTQIADAPAQIYTGGAAASNGSDKILAIAGAGTNTYSDGLYSYVMQTANSAVVPSGSYVSGTIDLTANYRYAGLNVTYIPANNTTLTVSTRGSPNGSTWSTWQQASEQKVVGNTYTYKFGSSINRYIQIKFDLASSDGVYSGTIQDYTVSYYQDTNTPNNPTVLSAYSTATQSATITTNTWYNYATPYFSWPAAETAGGASDPSNGSGVTGYYVYFGVGATADPVSLGTIMTGTTYTPSNLVSGNTYYLRIRAKDDAGNVSSTTWQPFIYKFDNVAPTNPAIFAVEPAGYTANNNFSISWIEASDSASLLNGYCYKTGQTNASETCTPTASVSGALAYKTGTNTLFVRAVDNAGNTPSDYATTSFYYSSGSPGAPRNLGVSPSVNSVNEFAFSWIAPDPTTYSVPTADLRYFYTINQPPTSSNLAGQSPLSSTYISTGAYATQEVNVLYVLAWDGTYKDQAKTVKNIDYNNYAQVTFTASTTAPGIPENIDITDVSIKETQSWRLAFYWDPPTASGSGIDHYNVYRSGVDAASCSTNISAFSYIGNTAQTSFVDIGITQTKKYYCVKACDSTNNCSAASSTVSLYPDGKWRSAPTLVASPSASIKTKSSIVTWSTNRTANSFVKFGKVSGDYKSEVGTSDQQSLHVISLIGLDPGTTYYYKTLWTDEDGNTGSSSELSFTTNAAPFVSSVTFSDISIYSAEVDFTAKNGVKSTIQYGESIDYGLMQSIATSKLEATYAIKLTELKEGTIYHVRLVAEDDEGNTFSGDDYTFTTLPVPKIENLRIQQVVGMPSATIRLIWDSNAPISSIVSYYPASHPEQTLDQIRLALSLKHEIIMKDLTDETDYVFIIKGKDAAGNEATVITKKVQTSNDIRPPEIQNMNLESTIVGVGDAARAQIIVSWDTDEPSTTQVEYAQGTGSSYGQTTQEDTNLTMNHTVTISELTPSKIYHLRVISKDKANNVGKSPDTVNITPNATEEALNLVINNLAKTFGFLKGIQGGQ